MTTSITKTAAFAGFDDVQVMVFNKLTDYPGTHTCRIERVEVGTTRKGQTRYTVHMTAIESDSSKLTPGSSVEWTVFSQTDPKWNEAYFQGKIKRLLGVLTGVEPSKITTAQLDESLSDDQPLSGLMVRWEVKPRVNGRSGELARNTKTGAQVYEAYPVASVE